MDSLDVASLEPWTPIRVHGSVAEPLLDWAIVDGPFADPFFEQTVYRAMQHPFNGLFARTTPLEVVDAVADALPPGKPTGLVFHMSRCGSTLIAQMLSRLSSAVVLSEPQPLDGFLRLHRAGGLGEELAARRLRALVRVLGRPQRGEDQLFVKLHAWHVVDLPLFARAFPDVPWVFAFREPRAVLRSQEKNPGAEIVPGTLDPRLAGIEPSALGSVSPLEYCARMLAAFCNAALAYAGTGRARCVAYDSLPDAVFSEVLPFFGVSPDASETERMRAAAMIDAKSEGDAFRPPTVRVASTEIDHLATRWLDPLYERLRKFSG